jgi:hypothetical protein
MHGFMETLDMESTSECSVHKQFLLQPLLVEVEIIARI